MRNLHASRWPLLALIAGVVLLVLAGVGLLAAYILLSRQPAPETGWVNPVAQVAPDAVAPDLAVLTLAGEPDERVIRAALDAGEAEAAYATLAYGLLLPDNLRSGSWLLFGGNSRERDPARSEVAYQAALDHAALAPGLSDHARADVSLLVAQGYTALEKPWRARVAVDQAESIAHHSLTLLPAQRRSLLTRVAEAYRTLGDERAGQVIRSNLEVLSAGPGVSLAPEPQVLPTLRGAVILPAPVVAAMAERQQAAAILAARWLSAGSTARSSLAEALGQALQREDAARADFYAEAPQLALSDRLALLHDQVAWLTVKYRVAARAFGVSLVPGWEAQVADIGVASANAVTGLINGYGLQLDTLDPTEATQARVELLREAMLWLRLGLFPSPVEELLSQQLADASRELWTRQGGVGLMIVRREVRGHPFYVLSGTAGAGAQKYRRSDNVSW